MTGSVTSEQLHHVVEAAGLAPSVHNTQPWMFVSVSGGLELHADPARRLPVLDADGRQLHLSCGAALFHARAAARALGVAVQVELLPDQSRPELLARVHLAPGAAATEDELDVATAILRRHTYRGTFEPRPVPAALVDQLRRDAEREQVVLHEVQDRDALLELEVLLSRADDDEQRDGAYRTELAQWVRTDPGATDGMAVQTLAVAPGSSLRQRDWTLTHPAAADGSAPVVDHPLVLVLATPVDRPVAWLQTGQALTAVLLRAAGHGVQAQPLGQVTDVLAYRLRLRGVLGVLAVPQLVLRVGYADCHTATPRRDVGDVLTAVAGSPA